MAASYGNNQQSSQGTPFNNESNGFSADNAQQAIEEAKAVSQPLDADLTAISALTGTGIVVRTATNTWNTRTLEAVTPIVITDGGGLSSNPTISHATSGVTASTYGSVSQVPKITVNSTGHITNVSLETINPINLTVSGVSTTGTVTTTSATYSIISGMTLTPLAGTYIVMFSGSVYNTGVNTEGEFAIFAAGAAVEARIIDCTVSIAGLITLSTNQVEVPGHILAQVSVNGSQAIDVRFRRSDGTGNIGCGPRRLQLIRVG